MRRLMLLPPLIGGLLLAAPAGPAWAQVTLDLRALDALPHTAPAPPAATPVPAPPPASPHPPPHPPRRRPLAVVLAPKPPNSPVAPSAPPLAAAPVPALPVPAAPAPSAPFVAAAPPPPPAGPLAAAAPGPTALPRPAALHLAFPAGQSFLTPDQIRAIGRMVRATPRSAATRYSVLAYAPASPQNPSAARGLALARALAVHDALRAAGVPGTAIFVRAIAAPGQADRAELGASLPEPTPVEPTR